MVTRGARVRPDDEKRAWFQMSRGNKQVDVDG